MQSLGNIISLKTPGPPVDPGPPRDFPAINSTDAGSRLSLFSTFVDLATRERAGIRTSRARRVYRYTLIVIALYDAQPARAVPP